MPSMSAAAETSRATVGGTETDGSPLLTVQNLTRRYGSRVAVDEVSFTLGPGITGLLGPNGAGKSSLMTCLAGIAAWENGSIQVGNADVGRNPRTARKLLGFMPERVAFPNEMRVTEYLHFVAEVKRIPRAERKDAVDLGIARTGLTAVADRIVGNLSKGNKQRVGMAQALMGDPLVTVLDEPMNGLDPLNILDMRAMLQEYGRTRSVIVSTHLLTDARLMCNNVLVMARGKLVYRGAPSEMAEGMGHTLRLRVRIHAQVAPQSSDLVEGTMLIDVTPDDRGTTVLVQARDDTVVPALVRAWADKWPVTTVESTADSLEEAFREAVLGSVSAGTEVTEHQKAIVQKQDD
jgi:ABC-2 type transport system ATP-binding protein